MCVIEDRECYLTVHHKKKKTVHHIVFVDILLSYISNECITFQNVSQMHTKI